MTRRDASILSHSRTFEAEVEAEEKKTRSRKPAAKKEESAATINNVAAAQSLGDFDALAALKAQMEKGE